MSGTMAFLLAALVDHIPQLDLHHIIVVLVLPRDVRRLQPSIMSQKK